MTSQTTRRRCARADQRRCRSAGRKQKIAAIHQTVAICATVARVAEEIAQYWLSIAAIQQSVESQIDLEKFVSCEMCKMLINDERQHTIADIARTQPHTNTNIRVAVMHVYMYLCV